MLDTVLKQEQMKSLTGRAFATLGSSWARAQVTQSLQASTISPMSRLLAPFMQDFERNFKVAQPMPPEPPKPPEPPQPPKPPEVPDSGKVEQDSKRKSAKAQKISTDWQWIRSDDQHVYAEAPNDPGRAKKKNDAFFNPQEHQAPKRLSSLKDAVHKNLEDANKTYQEVKEKAKEKVGEMPERAKEKLGEMPERAKEKLGEISERTKEKLGEIPKRAKEVEHKIESRGAKLAKKVKEWVKGESDQTK